MRVKDIITSYPNQIIPGTIRHGNRLSGLDAIAVEGLQIEIHATVNATELFILHDILGGDNIRLYGAHGMHLALLYEVMEDVESLSKDAAAALHTDIQSVWFYVNNNKFNEYPFDTAVPMAFICYDVALLFSGKDVSWIVTDIDKILAPNIKEDIIQTLSASLHMIAKWFLLAENNNGEKLDDYYDYPKESNSFRQISIAAGGKVFGTRQTSTDKEQCEDTINARMAMEDSIFNRARIIVAGTVPISTYLDMLLMFGIDASKNSLWFDRIASIKEYLESDDATGLPPEYTRLLTKVDDIFAEDQSLERFMWMPTNTVLHTVFKMDIDVGPGSHPWEKVNRVKQPHLQPFKDYLGTTIRILSDRNI